VDSRDIYLSKIAGLLVGTAVGDAIGLAREGLSFRRAEQLFGGAPLRYNLLPGRGFGSDDTEHTCIVAQSLLAAPNSVEKFSCELAWRLRWWLVGLPAGIGWATLRSILKLWLGFSPARSGVYSAGNGPAMRSAIIGACFASDDHQLRAYVAAATLITHSDPKALDGALAVALAAQYGMQNGAASFDRQAIIERIEKSVSDAEFRTRLKSIAGHLARQSLPADVAHEFGLTRGVTGYVLDTVPLALFCWLRWPTDFRMAVEQVILLGGDTDTTGAIVGALSGATNGLDSIPVEWRNGWNDWPRSMPWIEAVAERLTRQFHDGSISDVIGPQPIFWPGIVPRNLLFAIVVVLHALRRLLPPY
jgi:ADP-ribosyl-[dinitrogen reductase] hydrolase